VAPEKGSWRSGSCFSAYWTTWGSLGEKTFTDGGAVLKAPLSGGSSTIVASDQSFAGTLLIDGATIYWSEGGIVSPVSDGTIRPAPSSGGTITTLVSGQDAIQGVAKDATSIYWTSGGCRDEKLVRQDHAALR
jgi:hypothetical protein